MKQTKLEWLFDMTSELVTQYGMPELNPTILSSFGEGCPFYMGLVYR